MNLNTLPFNWFDMVVLVVLFIGMRSGRKHGMSEELPGLLKWLAIIFGCAFAYQPLGQALSNSSAVFSELDAYLIAYTGTALVIAAAFAALKSALGEKWISSEVFGRSEFYLGMISGCVRLSCMLIAAMALINARSYNTTEVSASAKSQKEMYGSDFFPTFYSLQSQVFQKSMLGRTVKDEAPFLLIKPTRPEKKEIKRKEILQ